MQHYEDPEVAIVGGHQVPDHPNFFDKFDRAHYDDEHLEIRKIREIRGWEGLYTNNLSVRREVFERVGYFDERFATGSDPEFVRRASRAGYVLVRDPELCVQHLKVHTLRSYLRVRFRRGCGSILLDVKEGSLPIRRFMPLPNLTRAGVDWRSFVRLYGSDPTDLVRFWALVFIGRLVDVAGRVDYYWTVGRAYRASLEEE